MTEQQYSVQQWSALNESKRQELIDLVAKLGYDVEKMSAFAMTRTGYHQFQHDENGRKIYSSRSGEAFTVFTPWLSENDFEQILPFLAPSPPTLTIEARIENGELVIPAEDIRIAFDRIQNEETE